MRSPADVVGAGSAAALEQLAAAVDDRAARVSRQVLFLTAVRAHQLQRLDPVERALSAAAANHEVHEHREVPA